MVGNVFECIVLRHTQFVSGPQLQASLIVKRETIYLSATTLPGSNSSNRVGHEESRQWQAEAETENW